MSQCISLFLLVLNSFNFQQARGFQYKFYFSPSEHKEIKNNLDRIEILIIANLTHKKLISN